MEIKDLIISITAILTSLIAIASIVFSSLNTKKILRANREQMKENNLINLRKEWIQDFSNLSANIFKTMIKEFKHDKAYFIYTPDDQVKKSNFYSDMLDELQYLQHLLFLKIRLNGTFLKELNNVVEEFYSGFLQLHFDKITDEEKKKINIQLLELPYTFREKSRQIIEEETKLILE